MALNDRQLRILRVIDEGHTTGDAIVDALGSSLQMLSHYANQMVEDGYIKAAKVYDNELRDFVIVRAYLTPEGKSALAAHQPVAAGAENPTAVTTIGSTAITTGDAIDYAGVSASIDRMAAIIAELPADWRDMAEVYLDDLKGEINIAYRRRPIRIRAYFLAILRMLLPVISKFSNSDDFIAQTRLLSQQLGIPVKFPGD